MKYSGRGRRGRPAGASPQFSVKVFIGVEYECSSGHRFMLAGPDKVLKATPGSIVKDTGHKVAESDMPLYYPCLCRANKLAQLMRIHVVTPKAPVYCTLDPKVRIVIFLLIGMNVQNVLIFGIFNFCFRYNRPQEPLFLYVLRRDQRN